MKSLFIDIKDNESRYYFFSVKNGRFEHIETKIYSGVDNYFFNIKNSGNY